MTTQQPAALWIAYELEIGTFVPNVLQNEIVLRQSAAAELRRQHARITELEAQLSSSGFAAADMASASAQGFRDGVASLAANAGSEPVAGMNEYGVRGYLAATLKCWHRLTGDEAAELVAMTQRLSGLYTHPSPPEGMVGGWKDIATAPRDGTRILIHPAVEVHDAWSKGYWSEQQECWIVGGSPSGVVHTAWHPLPPAPSTDGESNECRN